MYVVSIASRGTSGDWFQINLSDGSSFFISFETLQTNHLSSGSDVSPDLIPIFEYDTLFYETYQKAVDLLQRSEHSSGRLRQKLYQRKFPKDVVEKVIFLLEKKNYLSNERFASLWAASRLRQKPEGYSMLLAGLLQRGVDKNTAQKVLATEVTEEDWIDAVFRAGEKLLRARNMTRDTLKTKLYKKGFSGNQISIFFEEYASSIDELE